MKAIFSIALVALMSCIVSAHITKNTTNFIVGTWYTQYYNITSDCCTPVGTITFTGSGDSKAVLSATQWEGSLCEELDITPSSSLTTAFTSSASFEELPHMLDITDASDFEKGLGDDGLYYFVDGLFDAYTFTNGTQEVLVILDV